ncbi:MAG: DUF4123 domain-containing protein [Pseudomonadota bacterium]
MTSENNSLPALAAANPCWNWYAIADSAQHKALPAAIVDDNERVRCLFGAPQGSPVAAQSPHLVQLAAPTRGGHAWDWIRRNAACRSSVSIIATTMTFAELFEQLAANAEVELPDATSMFLGFWDPAILGTLIGQPDDSTLHVPGPVLGEIQRSAFLQRLAGWWYWDREGAFHGVDRLPVHGAAAVAPIAFTQRQVDQLVEASVPDHVMYFVELNQAPLLDGGAPSAHYRRIRGYIQEARHIGLDRMDDLVNYVCVSLIYGDRRHDDASIREIFKSVKEGGVSFDTALTMLP